MICMIKKVKKIIESIDFYWIELLLIFFLATLLISALLVTFDCSKKTTNETYTTETHTVVYCPHCGEKIEFIIKWGLYG